MSDVQNNLGEVGEILSPCCDEEIQVSDIVDKLKCPLCKTNLKQRAFLPFLEYLMENGHVENLDFFDLDLYSQDKESLDSQDEELDLEKYEVNKDSLNIYEDDKRLGSPTPVSQTSIDESSISSDWTKFAIEDSE
jgi:hypothetical protein